MNEKASRLRQYSNRSRRVFMQAVGGAGAALAISSSASASEHDGPTEIDSCTVIDEPGEYELVADLEPTEIEPSQARPPSCIQINVSDVTFRGNGHTIDGTRMAGDRAVADAAGVGVNPTSIELGGSVDNVTVENVQITGFGSGVSYGPGGEQSQLSNINAHANGTAISLSPDAWRIHIENNHLTNNGLGIGTGYFEYGTFAITIEYNTIESNGIGVFFTVEAQNNEVRHNRIVGNYIGASQAIFGSRNVFQRNAICNNEAFGIHNADTPGNPTIDPGMDVPQPREEDVIEATLNYWGAANGPSSGLGSPSDPIREPPEPFTDPETGAPADGDGDAISESLDPGVANIHFDPFLESYPEEAGADL